MRKHYTVNSRKRAQLLLVSSLFYNCLCPALHPQRGGAILCVALKRATQGVSFQLTNTSTQPGLPMSLSIAFLLLVQGINTLLNWFVVMLVQRSYLTSSFMGAFCISLTLMDTLFTITTLALYGLQDFRLFGVRFTTHHICLLVQVAGLVYNTLQWPVLFAATLDYYSSFPVGSKQTLKSLKLNYAACAGALWVFVLLYAFTRPAFHPALEESPHLLLDHCQTQRDRMSCLISVALLVTVGGVMLYARLVAGKDKPMEETKRHPVQKPQKCDPSRIHILAQYFSTFMRTWAAFLILVVVILTFRIDVPSHLTMNVPWLAFLNSFMISVSLCIHYQKLKTNNMSTFTDGFCLWNLAVMNG